MTTAPAANSYLLRGGVVLPVDGEVAPGPADLLVREASRRGALVRLRGWSAYAWEQRLVRALGEDRASFFWATPTGHDAPTERGTAPTPSEDPSLIAAEVNSASSGTGAALSVTEPVTLGEWHHVGASYDGTTLRLYLDGTEVGSLSRSVTMGYTSGTNDVWCLGGNPAASEENVKGRMKDVRIAQVARDAAWFRQVYQRGRGTWNG
jgi:hypothetical protein